MYNENIKASIYKYIEKVKYTEDYKNKAKSWAKSYYERIKKENSERYENKKFNNRLRYYKKIIFKSDEEYKKFLDKIKIKDEKIYKQLIKG